MNKFKINTKLMLTDESIQNQYKTNIDESRWICEN